MNRQIIERNYVVDSSGRIRSPGKFEGEMLYVPHFWDAGMSGLADRDNGEIMRTNCALQGLG